MKKVLFIFICSILALLAGCKEEQRKEPEVKGTVDEWSTEVSLMSPHEGKEQGIPLSMTIHHHIKGQQVYVECIVGPDFHFTEDSHDKKQGEGRLHVYVDGKYLETQSQGAFIVKGIPTGKHTITVKLMHNDQTEYGISETFDIEIK